MASIPIDGIGDGAVDVLDGPLYALSAVAVSAVSKLDGFECPGRCPRGNQRPAEATASERDIGLDGRVAPGVEDLAGPDRSNRGHGPS